MPIGSFNPREIKKMLLIIKSKNYDFIFASRYEKIVVVKMIL